MYIHTCICAHAFIHAHTYTQVRTMVAEGHVNNLCNIFVHQYMSIHVYERTHLYTHIHIRIRIRLEIRIRIHTYICDAFRTYTHIRIHIQAHLRQRHILTPFPLQRPIASCINAMFGSGGGLASNFDPT